MPAERLLLLVQAPPVPGRDAVLLVGLVSAPAAGQEGRKTQSSELWLITGYSLARALSLISLFS